jgi:hypothetical protein
MCYEVAIQWESRNLHLCCQKLISTRVSISLITNVTDGYERRMYLALGCARGVWAIHSHSPALQLCHRDIKSFNFLGEQSHYRR